MSSKKYAVWWICPLSRSGGEISSHRTYKEACARMRECVKENPHVSYEVTGGKYWFRYRPSTGFEED